MAFVKIVNQDKLNIVSSATNVADQIGAYATRGMSADASLDKAFDDIRGAWGGGVGHWAQGEADREAGVPLVTQEFADDISQKYGIKLDIGKGETVGQYLFRLDRMLQDGVNQARISREFPVTNFISSLPAQFQEPSNYFPLSLALRTVATPLRVLRASKKINKTAAAINRGQRFKAALYGGRDLLRDNLVFNTLVQPLYTADRQRMGQETSLGESIYEVGMSSIVGTGLFLPIVTGLNVRAANINLKNAQTFQDVYSFMNTGQFEKAASVAYASSPQFRKAVKRADEFSDFVDDAIKTDGVLRLSNLDPQQVETLKGILNSHMESSLQSAVTNKITDEIVENLKEDSELPIQQKSEKYKQMFSNVYTAIKRKNTQGLTPKEIEIVNSIVKDSDDLHVFKDEDGQERIGSAFDLDAQLRADTFAQTIYDLFRKYKTTSLQDLVDRGVMTQPQRIKFLRKFNKVYKKGYAKEIAVASRVIDEVFGGSFTFKKAQDKNEMAFGFYRREGATRAEKETLYLNRMDFITGANQSPFSILFHEAMHALQVRDKDSYNQIENIIFEHPKLREQIDAMTESRGYTGMSIPFERVPALIEWAITTPEFWAELNKSNKALFTKMKYAIQKLVSEMQIKYFEGARSKYVSDDILPTLLEPGTTPGQLATKIGEIINNSKSKVGNKHWLANAKERHRGNMRRLTVTEADATPDTVSNFIKQYAGKSLDAVDSLTDKAFLEGLAEDLGQYIPPESFSKGGPAEFLRELFKFRDETNLDVDPDSTEMISFSEFKATIREKLAFYEEDGSLTDVFSEQEYTRLYDIARDAYRDSTLGIKNLKNIELKRELLKNDPEEIQNRIGAFYFHKFVKEIRNISKEHKITKLMKEELGGASTVTDQIRWLRSYLDGRDRSARTGRAGLEHHMIADGQQTVVPLMDVLLKHNLVEIFLPEQGLSFLRAFRNRDSSKTWKMFGKNRKAQSKEFFRQLHEGLIKRELPDNWQGVEALEELFSVLQAIEVKTLADLNKAGLDIRQLSDFGGITQKWDSDIIYNMGYDEFYLLMDKYMDKDDTASRMANILIDADGNEVAWTFDRFMEQWYDSLDPNKKTGDNVQLLDLGDAFGSRNVAILPEFATDAALQFSGYESIGHLMIAQMQRRGALAAMTDIAGSRPSESLKRLVENIGSQNPRRMSQKDLYLKTVDKITGLLDNPVDATMGAYTNRAMRYSNVVFLSGSGITSLTDIPNAIATLDVMGISTRQYINDFLVAYGQGTARRFGRDKQGMKSYFLKLSATFDVLNNSVAQRITDLSPEKGSTFEAKLNQLMFKLNGLNALTTTSEEMFVDILTRFISDALDDPNGVMTQKLIEFGFTKSEVKQLTKQTKTPDGVDRLDIDSLSPSARKKFDRYVTKYIRQGVFRPDAGTQVSTVFGTRAGTPIGSASRLLTQYASFMLGMSQNIYYRMKNSISDSRAVDDVMLYKTAHFISFVAGSIAFAYISTVLKDLAKGKEPINLVDMNSREFSRVVQQSGLLGILEIPLDMYDFGVTEAAAPLPSTLFGLMGEIGTADLTGAYKKVQDLTGENIYGPPQWFHTYTGHYVLEYLNEIEQWLLDDSQR